MKILIIGAGSLGVYLGTMLNQKNKVLLLGREKLKNINNTILIHNSLYKIPEKIYSLPEKEKFDFVFLTSKLYDFEKNLKEMFSHKITSKYIISIQNGLVDNEPYKKYFGEAQFTSISVFEGFRLLQDQLIVNQSEQGWKTNTSQAGLEVSNLFCS